MGLLCGFNGLRVCRSYVRCVKDIQDRLVGLDMQGLCLV